MNIRGFFFTLFFIVITVVNGAGAPLSRSSEKEYQGSQGAITIELSETEITVADSLKLIVEITVPKGYQAKLPSFDEFGFSTDFNERSQRFRVTDISPVETKIESDGTKLLRQEFTLEPWLSGDYSILPLMVSYYKAAKDDATETASQQDQAPNETDLPGWRIPVFQVMSDGIRVKVAGMGEERSELSPLFKQADYTLERLSTKERRREDKSDHELKREEEEKKEAARKLSQKEFPWELFWVLLGILLLAPLFWYLGRRKIKNFFTKPGKPAHELAYEALEKLPTQELTTERQIKEFYYQLSYIMRDYIGNRFEIFAINQTSEEFFSQLLSSNPFDKESENILKLFSEHADTAKYSLNVPDADHAGDSFKVVRSFVDATRERESAVKEGAK